VPDRAISVKQPDGGAREYWTYIRTIPSSSGVTLNVPVVGGGVSLSGAGDCRATFELVEGRVTRIGYSGAPDLGPAADAACAPVVTGCLNFPVASG
jgi:hypothetical protein